MKTQDKQPLADVFASRTFLKAIAGSSTPTTDIHRFWDQTGNFYLSGRGNDNLFRNHGSLYFRRARQSRYRH